MRTVQVHSAADADLLAVKLADEAIDIGPPAAKKSYLNIEAIIDSGQGRKRRRHPSRLWLPVRERRFRRGRCRCRHDLRRPRCGDAIRLLGDKVAARKVAAKAGVPTVPGSDGRVSDLEEATAIVERSAFRS